MRALPFLSLALSARGNLVTFSMRYAADPAPIVHGDKLYVSMTHDHANATSWGDLYDYSLISTRDMVNFADEGIIFDARNATWGPKGAWAQQIISASDGLAGPGFYLYWPNIGGVWADRSGVGIAFSPNMTGPYEDITPLFNYPKGIMPGEDPTVFRDPDSGRVYLCSAPSADQTFLCGELNATTMGTWTQAPQTIQGFSHGYEAPWLQRMPAAGNSSGSPWLMTYMCPNGKSFAPGPGGGHYGYDICQATCTGDACPLSTFTFHDAPLLWNPPFDCDTPYGCSTGSGSNSHHGLVQFHGKWYLFYHTRLLPATRGLSATYVRNAAVDAAYLNGTTGTFFPVSSTPNWLRQLAWVDPFTAPLPAVLMAEGSDNLVSVKPDDAAGAGASMVLAYPPSDVAWTKVSGVEFGATTTLLEWHLRVATLASNIAVQLIIDGLGMGPITQLRLSNTGGSWANVSARVQVAVTGPHDVFVAVDTRNADPPAAGNATSAIAWIASWQLTGSAVTRGSKPPAVMVPCAGLSSKSTAGFVSASATGGAAAPLVATNATTPGPLTSLLLVDNEDGTYALQALGLAVSAEESREVWDEGMSSAGGLVPPAGWPRPRRLTASPYAASDENSWNGGATFLAGAAAGPGALVVYVCAPTDGGALTAAATSPTDPCARFSLQGTTEGSYVLIAAQSGLAVAVNTTTGTLHAVASDPRLVEGDAARFWLTCGSPLQPGGNL